MGLEGKVAIVTGAARGTGAAIAERFCLEGTHVMLCDSAIRFLSENIDYMTYQRLGDRADGEMIELE